MVAAGAPRRAAETWGQMVEGNPVLTVVDTLLRGTGQVMFQNNPLTGLIFLAGIFVNSGKLGGLGILGLATSTLTAYLLGADRTLIRNGLFGFNGILVGIGLAFFLNYNGLLIGYIILGGALSTVAFMALANLLSVWDMPALTAPFVLTAWLLLFAVLLFANLRPNLLFIAPAAPDVRVLPPTALREAATGVGAIGLTPVNMTNALFRGIGEVMFQDKLATGVIFLFAIFVNSRISALFAFLGSVLGGWTAWTIGASGIAIFHGLYGFNSVLTGIALSGLRRHRRVPRAHRHAGADRTVRAGDVDLPVGEGRVQGAGADGPCRHHHRRGPPGRLPDGGSRADRAHGRRALMTRGQARTTD